MIQPINLHQEIKGLESATQGDLKNNLIQLFETHVKERPEEGIKIAAYLAYYDKELAIALTQPIANEWLKENKTKEVGLKAYALLLE